LRLVGLTFIYLRKSVEKTQDLLKSGIITRILHSDICTFMTVIRRIFLTTRNISHEICSLQSGQTFHVQQLALENGAVYDVM